MQDTNASPAVAKALALAEQAGERGARRALEAHMSAQQTTTPAQAPQAQATTPAPAQVILTPEQLAAHAAQAVAADRAQRAGSLLPRAEAHDLAVLTLGVGLGVGGTLLAQKLAGGSAEPTE